MSNGHSKKRKENTNPVSKVHSKSPVNPKKKIGLTGIILISLYLISEFIPHFGAIDPMGSQWLYLSAVNIIASTYLLTQNRTVDASFFRNIFFLLYTCFILISATSFLVSYNVVESMVTFSRLLITTIALLNIYSIIILERNILRELFLFTGILVFVQSLQVFSELMENASVFNDVYRIIYNIKGNTGNKNILAASLVIKIPFVVYGLHCTKQLRRTFYFITLLLACIALLIVNARATFISLAGMMVFYFVVNVASYLREKEIRILKLSGLTLSIVVLSFIISQMIFSSIGKEKEQGDYGAVTRRVESISVSNAGSSGRIGIWKSSIDFIANHPLLGGGYGNWKIHSIPYEKSTIDGRGIRRHVHNDFLEVAADTGIPNGIIYAALFACLAFFGFRLHGGAPERKWIVVVSMMSLIAYVTDATFNFPLERPNMQIAFSLIAATLCFCYSEKFGKSTNSAGSGRQRIVLIVGIAISGFTIYVSYMVYMSMKVQNKIAAEWGEKPVELQVPVRSEDIIAQFPDIPNITEFEMPVASVKAKYLCQEGKFDEALALLNADRNSNPYLFYSEYLRARIFEKRNQPDSAYYYAKLASQNRAANLQLYNYYCRLVVQRKDTTALNHAFTEICKYNPRADVFVSYSDNIFACTNDEGLQRGVIMAGLVKHPGDTVLLLRKYFWEGFDNFNAKQYDSAVESYSKILELIEYPSARQNLALSYFNLKRYEDAARDFTVTIQSHAFSNGIPEYYRAECYRRTGQVAKACPDYLEAKRMGYNVDPVIVQSCMQYRDTVRAD